MFRQSYRRTVTGALISFFVVPAAFFTLWSALRLRQDVTSARGEEVARALRDIGDDPAFAADLLSDPRPPVLAQIADRVDTELGIYHRGRLVAASTPLLGALGLLAPVIDPALARGQDGVGRDLASPVPGANVRVGAQVTDVPATLVAAALPGGDADLARDQVDLALLLLLASLGGTIAAVAVAGAVARALAQPIEALRRRALAIGRREPAPPLRDPPLEFEPVFGALTQMERDLQQSEARLEEETARSARVVAWGEMARQVAHEIKNPLTPMRLGLQHLRRLGADRRPDLADQTASTADRLLLEIERLDRIARSFARYGSPPERDAGPLEAIDLAAVCHEVADLFTLAGAQPSVVVEGRSGEPVESRREELMQVLLNLLDNAGAAGADRIRLGLDEARLVVADNGRGIPADQLPRIFEPTFSTTTSGTGLGLAIVRRLVDDWGATIAVDSVPGEGTVFTIRFRPAGSTGSPDGA
jgi:signal transduction histidine kinase